MRLAPALAAATTMRASQKDNVARDDSCMASRTTLQPVTPTGQAAIWSRYRRMLGRVTRLHFALQATNGSWHYLRAGPERFQGSTSRLGFDWCERSRLSKSRPLPAD